MLRVKLLFSEVPLKLHSDFEFTPRPPEDTWQLQKERINVGGEVGSHAALFFYFYLYNILTHFPHWKVQSDYINCNLIIEASTCISVGVCSKKSYRESVKFVSPQLMEIQLEAM